MHPREALRRHVTDEIRACLPPSAFVSSSLVRDIPTSAGLAAVVFTPSEIIQRVSANGKARASQPVKRTTRNSVRIPSVHHR